jgi:anti-anti-sigma factor
MDLTLDIRHTSDVSIVRMIGPLTVETYSAFQECAKGFDEMLQRYVVANLDLVTSVDVSGFCSLLHLAQHLRENRRALAVVINDEPARNALAMMGLDFVCSSEATAVTAFHHLAILKELNRWPKAS